MIGPRASSYDLPLPYSQHPQVFRGLPKVRPGQGGESDPPHIWLPPFSTPCPLCTMENLLGFSFLICDVGPGCCHIHTQQSRGRTFLPLLAVAQCSWSWAPCPLPVAWVHQTGSLSISQGLGGARPVGTACSPRDTQVAFPHLAWGVVFGGASYPSALNPQYSLSFPRLPQPTILPSPPNP